MSAECGRVRAKAECPARLTPRARCAVLARDLQQVVFYDTKGQFVGVRRPGSGKPLEVSGVTFIVDELVGASGVQLKHDPGIAFVYTGFGFLMITTLIAYISHSQVGPAAPRRSDIRLRIYKEQNPVILRE